MRVLVCGGRDFQDSSLVELALSSLHTNELRGPIALLIHGGARGADTLAGTWAKKNGVPVRVFPADWQRYGKRAGFLRNKQMLDEGCPDVVVAFEGGLGTAMMIQLAENAGVKVIRP